MTSQEREALFTRCATELRPMLWRLAAAYAAPAEVEDLVQEVLLQIWNSLPTYREQARLSTWAYKVGLYTAMRWRRRTHRRADNAPLEAAPEPAAQVADPAQRDLLRRSLETIRSLPEADRAVLLLALEQVPRDEMAAVLGISTNAATVRLHRARALLQRHLERAPSA